VQISSNFAVPNFHTLCIPFTVTWSCYPFGLYLMINIYPAVSHRITQFFYMLQLGTLACNYSDVLSDVLMLLVLSAEGILEFLQFLLNI